MAFTVFLIAIIFIVAIVYNTRKSNKSFSSPVKRVDPKRLTVDSLKTINTSESSSNRMSCYGKFKKEIIECAYQDKFMPCDVVLNIDIDAQNVSYMELGNMRKFRCTRTVRSGAKFVSLEDITTNETHYLTMHYRNNHLFSFELTNSKDNGYIFFDETITNK